LHFDRLIIYLFRFFLSRSEESSGQLQLVEREDMEDEEDLFEAIDKRNFFQLCFPICDFVFLDQRTKTDLCH
jgi:hypothetical protein